MGAVGPIQLLIVGILFILLFGGRGKISSIMGDVAKGITSFKKGLKEDPDANSDKADDAIDVTPPKDDKKK
ncbi:MAG: Sec-independent protein translocase TatA [Hyphomonadaceae bacterium]|nr:Sec-independent protein translocase TatA [Hyphomonadaceae bacterium]